LKEILKQASFKRELNFQAIQDFLKLPIVPNKSTLIKGINKLLPQQYILIDGITGCFELESTNPRRKKVTKHFAKENLISSIANNIGILHNQLNSKDLACTLSGGFDTNTILHFLAKSTADITAVTIGGKRVNEIRNAIKMVNRYDNVRHTSSVVGENKLDTFPDIVWRLEGYVGQRGLFLQSELGEHLQKEGIKSIFLADCADQVLDQYRKSLPGFSANIIKELVKCLYTDRYTSKKNIAMFTGKFLYCRKNIDIDFDYIAKKNGIMLNSYGIQGIYPFLNRETTAICKALGILGFRKFFYRKEVKRLLGERSSNIISKVPGTTDIEYLYEGKEGIISKLLSSKLAEEITSKEQIARITNNPTRYDYDLLLQVLFVYLFNELFITGKHDSIMDEPSLDIALDKFFD
jgi:asparagine synthase (glutamine-hydrolysing)